MKEKEISSRLNSDEGFQSPEFSKSLDSPVKPDDRPSLDIQPLANDELVSRPLDQSSSKKRRKTELDKLKIDMKGWNYLSSNPNAAHFVNNTFYSLQGSRCDEIEIEAAVTDVDAAVGEGIEVGSRESYEKNETKLFHDMIIDIPNDYDIFLL